MIAIDFTKWDNEEGTWVKRKIAPIKVISIKKP